MVLNAHAVIVSLQVISIGFLPIKQLKRWSTVQISAGKEQSQQHNQFLKNDLVPMPQATVHKASHRKPKQASQLLALEQELEDLGTSDPHSNMDLKNEVPSLPGSLMTCRFSVQAVSDISFRASPSTTLKWLYILTWNMMVFHLHKAPSHWFGVVLRGESRMGRRKDSYSVVFKTASVAKLSMFCSVV